MNKRKYNFIWVFSNAKRMTKQLCIRLMNGRNQATLFFPFAIPSHPPTMSGHRCPAEPVKIETGNNYLSIEWKRSRAHTDGV